MFEGFGSDSRHPSVATNAFALSSSCTLRGGLSGTPLVDQSLQVVGLIFTIDEGHGAQCEEKGPGEEGESGARHYVHGTSYVARTDQIARSANKISYRSLCPLHGYGCRKCSSPRWFCKVPFVDGGFDETAFESQDSSSSRIVT